MAYFSYIFLLQNRRNHDRSLEMETWHDLANVYTSLSQWRDAEVCLSKSQAINPYSASRWHATGILCFIHCFYVLAELEPYFLKNLLLCPSCLFEINHVLTPTW